jgi:ABC-2 type transport system ATP-binding protein
MKDAASVISIRDLTKVYDSGFRALNGVSLDICRGEILALLGPNGAGKTTLINIVCGIVNASSGSVAVDGHDHVRQFRAARSMIGLVPQELATDTFESVWATVSFSRGLHGKPSNPGHIERVLRSLSLWDKKDNRIMTLSGGMKRRVLIAKALSHEPQILFLDEPTAGVDPASRRLLWQWVYGLAKQGTTILVTTHYMDEAERCERLGFLSRGHLIAVGTVEQVLTQFAQPTIEDVFIELQRRDEGAVL